MSEIKKTATLRVCLRRKNIPNAELLADLRAVARSLNIRRLSTTVYDDHGKFHHDTFQHRFGSWTRAVTRAGLQSAHTLAVSPEAILRDIADVACQLKTTRLEVRQYKKRGRYSWRMVLNRFGSWSAATAAAGISARKSIPQNSQALLENLRDLWLTLDRQPKLDDLALPLSRFSREPYDTHFGTFNKAMLALDRFMNPRSKPLEPVTKSCRRGTSRQINLRLRFVILRRDKFRCCACGKSPATHAGVDLVIDHKIPWRDGGETVEANLQTLCEECNSGKSDLPWEE